MACSLVFLPGFLTNDNISSNRELLAKKKKGEICLKNEKLTVWDPLGDLGVLAVCFYQLTFQVVK